MVDAILLAGGYATRLYPLTLDQPKALLPVGGRKILDRIVDELMVSDLIGRFFLVTNEKFAADFTRWGASRTWEKPFEVLNDGTTSNDDRLGAIGDIQFVLDRADVCTEKGMFVLGTDNLARFDITQVVAEMKRRDATCIFAGRVDDPKRLKRMGIVVFDEDHRVLDFEEKPQEPKSDYAVPPFYAYSPDAVPMIQRYLSEGNEPDAPGHMIAWLKDHAPVYVVPTEETVLDIGTKDAYDKVCAEYENA